MRRFDTSPRRAAPKGLTFISCTAPRLITQLPSDLPRSWHTPVAQRALIEVYLPGHFGDRTRRLDHHLHRLVPELRRELPPPSGRLSLHFGPDLVGSGVRNLRGSPRSLSRGARPGFSSEDGDADIGGE